MEWWKAKADFHERQEVLDLRDDCGVEGYGVLMIVMGIVCGLYNVGSPPVAVFTKKQWGRKLDVHPHTVDKYLGVETDDGAKPGRLAANIPWLLVEWREGKCTVTAQMIKELHDETAQKKQREMKKRDAKSGNAPDEGGTESAHTIEDKNRKNHNHTGDGDGDLYRDGFHGDGDGKKRGGDPSQIGEGVNGAIDALEKCKNGSEPIDNTPAGRAHDFRMDSLSLLRRHSSAKTEGSEEHISDFAGLVCRALGGKKDESLGRVIQCINDYTGESVRLAVVELLEDKEINGLPAAKQAKKRFQFLETRARRHNEKRQQRTQKGEA